MKKPDYVSPDFFGTLVSYKPKQKVFWRNTSLIPYMHGKTFIVHNGTTFLSVSVSQDIIGHKLGEFSQTRRRYYFRKKKLTQKKKKK